MGQAIIDTYGCDKILAGSNLFFTDNGDGSATLNVDASGLGGNKDFYYPKNVGTTGGCGERWYLGGYAVAGGSGTTTGVGITAGVLYCMPFIAPRGGTLDRIAIRTGAAASGNARLGIYASKSDTDLYPGALLLDAGAVAIGGGTDRVNSINISQALVAGKTYWLVADFDTNNTNNVYFMGQSNVWGVLGVDNTLLGLGTNLSATQAYGALPDPFPAGGAVGGGGGLLIGVRFSA